ncbi:MAG TPA: CTB family bacteriocin [Nostocaceae cyanobacterium]|nr:CTB family bacteriocin [Nostocaceae cyanobacterium]
MSYPIVASNFLYVDLSTRQQELINGGADFELSGTNFANRIVTLRGSTSSGPNGSFASSSGLSSLINTAAQDWLGLGARTVPRLPALGNAPIF